MAPWLHCIRTAHELATRRTADRWRLRDLLDQRRADAFLRGLPACVPRGVPLEPRRDVAGLLRLGVRERRERAVRRGAGGPPRPSTARAPRRRRANAWAPGQRLRPRALAAHRA